MTALFLTLNPNLPGTPIGNNYCVSFAVSMSERCAQFFSIQSYLTVVLLRIRMILLISMWSLICEQQASRRSGKDFSTCRTTRIV